MKICKMCEEEKNIKDFYTNGRGGHNGRCKVCYNLQLLSKEDNGRKGCKPI